MFRRTTLTIHLGGYFGSKNQTNRRTDIRYGGIQKLISSGAYDALRSSGILVLPSEWTLRDYTHWMKAASGFIEAVDKQLMDDAKIKDLQELLKFVCLLLDEVRIKEQLVYDKHSCEIVGFVNLGDVNIELLEMERAKKGDMQQCMAKIMLVFMVRGLYLKLEFPYAQFPCSSLSGEFMYPLVCYARMTFDLGLGVRLHQDYVCSSICSCLQMHSMFS